MGSRHYTPAVDMWAIGCIFAELLSLRPIFKGEEAKMDSKKTVPFQRNQMMKIVEILGLPRKESWPGLASMPEYSQLQSLVLHRQPSHFHRGSNLEGWYHTRPPPVPVLPVQMDSIFYRVCSNMTLASG